VLRGPQAAFIIELPPYRRPRLRAVIRAMWDRSVLFLRDAGTIIFAVSVILWACAYFPRAEPSAQLQDPGLQIRQSILGHAGRVLEPLIRPLGFDWKIGIGLAGSFAAREVFVSTMGIVYGLGDGADEGSVTLRDKIAADTWPDGSRLYTPLVGVSLMAFYVLACQCVSTLGVVKRETNSWRWPLFMFAYMTALAYAASLVIYQVGSRLGWGG
jgi:ferrous iron transport protein B